MRAKWTGVWTLASGLVFSGQVHGHFGDRIYPILEITDDMLAQIELDGLIDEWPELYGEPTLTPLERITGCNNPFGSSSPSHWRASSL